MVKDNVSVAVIGCGYWGKNLVRKFHELGALQAISDPNETVLKTFQETYGVKGLSPEEIFASSSIDAVVIAAPAELHHELTMQALKSGKHVFVEKPIALNLQQAQEMYDTAQAASKVLMVGHLLQYHPAFLKLKQLVQAGDIGKVNYIYSRRLNIGKLRTHENVLWSFAPHDISMILALSGQEPNKISGQSSSFLQENVSDFATVHMEFPSGAKAHVEVSWLNPFKEQRLVVIGSEGMIEFDDQADWSGKLKLYKHTAKIVNGEPELQKADPVEIEVDEFEPLLNECKHFIDFIKTNTEPFTNGREAIAVLKVLQDGDV